MKFMTFKLPGGKPVFVNLAVIEFVEASGTAQAVIHLSSGDHLLVAGDPSLIVREIETRGKQDAV